MLPDMGLSATSTARYALVVLVALCPVVGSVTGAAAQGVSIDVATDAQKKEAQSHYDRGARAFDAKKFEDAFNAFAASYGVVKSPNAHMMMARSLMALGRNARAYNELGLVEDEARGNPKYAQTLERTKELRAEAAQKIAVVTVKLVGERTGPVRVTINDQLVPVERPFGLEPGKLVVKSVVNDKPGESKEVDVSAGKAETVEIRVGADAKTPPVPAATAPAPTATTTAAPTVPPPTAPPPEQTPRSPAGTGLLIGGTAVGLLGLGGMAIGAGFYFAAQDNYDYLQDTRQSGCIQQGGGFVCPERAQERIDAGKDNQQAAGIAVGVGSAVTAVGLGMLIAGGVLVSAPAEQAKAPAVRVGAGAGSVWVGGEF
jgi:hypothetical protein